MANPTNWHPNTLVKNPRYDQYHNPHSYLNDTAPQTLDYALSFRIGYSQGFMTCVAQLLHNRKRTFLQKLSDHISNWRYHRRFRLGAKPPISNPPIVAFELRNAPGKELWYRTGFDRGYSRPLDLLEEGYTLQQVKDHIQALTHWQADCTAENYTQHPPTYP